MEGRIALGIISLAMSMLMMQPEPQGDVESSTDGGGDVIFDLDKLPKTADEIDEGDAPKPEPEVIEFKPPADPNPFDKQKENAPKTGAWHGDTESKSRGNDAMLASRVDGLEESLQAIKKDLSWLRENVATKEDIIGIKRVIIEYRHPSTGQASTEVEIDSQGNGSVELPPAAVVESIGGMELQNWAPQPQVVLSSPVESYSGNIVLSSPNSGSQGGNVALSASSGGGCQGGNVALSSQMQQPIVMESAPLSSSSWEVQSAPMIQSSPVVSSSYVLENQAEAVVVATPESTEVILSVEPEYLSAPVESEYLAAPVAQENCYTDSLGNQVCPVPTASSAPSQPALRSRRQPLRNTARRILGR